MRREDLKLCENCKRWEEYRAEVMDMQKRMGKLGANFFDLQAYDDAATCAMKADSLALMIGRMPNCGPNLSREPRDQQPEPNLEIADEDAAINAARMCGEMVEPKVLCNYHHDDCPDFHPICNHYQIADRTCTHKPEPKLVCYHKLR